MGQACSCQKSVKSTTKSTGTYQCELDTLVQSDVLLATNNFIHTIELVGSLELVPDLVREHMNQLILSRATLIHCLLRLNKQMTNGAKRDSQIRNAEHDYLEVLLELGHITRQIQYLLETPGFQEYFPIISKSLEQQLQDITDLQLQCRPPLQKRNSEKTLRTQRISIRQYSQIV